MSAANSCVAVYGTHVEAEKAIGKLKQSGFPMEQLCIVGRDYHSEENVVGYYNAGDRMKSWGRLGAFWGGLWGFLFDSAFFLVPGIGPIAVDGPMVSWIVGALEGAAVAGGLSALGAGLYGIGIPKDSVLDYESAIKADKFVIVAHGTQDEDLKAQGILGAEGAEDVAFHPMELPA